MNYSVCIDALYQRRNVLEGIRETKEAGIGAIELWSWWDKDLGRIASERERPARHIYIWYLCPFLRQPHLSLPDTDSFPLMGR